MHCIASFLKDALFPGSRPRPTKFRGWSRLPCLLGGGTLTGSKKQNLARHVYNLQLGTAGERWACAPCFHPASAPEIENPARFYWNRFPWKLPIKCRPKEKQSVWTLHFFHAAILSWLGLGLGLEALWLGLGPLGLGLVMQWLGLGFGLAAPWLGLGLALDLGGLEYNTAIFPLRPHFSACLYIFFITKI